jgi:glycerol uptake facilitator protein
MADAYDSARIEATIVAGEVSTDVDATGEAPLFRRLAAEFFGTLVFVAVGTGAATVLALGPLQRLAGLSSLPGFEAPEQQQLFGAIIGTGGATISELLPVAFAFATALAVLVYALGGVSGAHFNPAVTFGLAVVRRFPWREIPGYWIAQCLGGVAGAFVVAGIYGQAGASSGGVDILFGATMVADAIKEPQAILAEAFIAFILVTAIMAVAVDPRAPKGWSGFIIGLGLAGGILVTANATGGSANFARSLGPFVASLIYDVDKIPWKDLLVYAVGPLIGASAAALVYESVTGLERVAPEPRPGAATSEEPYESDRGGTVV